MDDEWPASPYYLLVCKKENAPRCTVWPAFFQRPLPRIPIPLLPSDNDVSLALQPLIEAVYARSHYELDIDYQQALRPALSDVDVAWLQERLTQNSPSP